MEAYDRWGLPPGHGLDPGEIAVAAGVSEEHGNVVVTCPPGGSACAVRVSADRTVEYARTGGIPTFMFAHRSYERGNPAAEDLLDHWNEPEPLRAALGLSPVAPADIAGRKSVLADLINAAGGDSAETGTLLRNVAAEDIEIIGERSGITYGRWTGGPAGTLNIEFDWRFAPTLDVERRARMERAGKSWSWRILDDFGVNVVERGTKVRHYGGPEGTFFSGVIDEDLSTDGLLIAVLGGDSDSWRSSAAFHRFRATDDDFEPWFGAILLSQRDSDITFGLAHEIGHVLGIGTTTHLRSVSRYINRTNHTFEGPEARRANGGAAVPYQWLDERIEPVPPHTPGATVDYGHLGVCTSLMAYCNDRRETYRPSELDFAYLDDIGYEILDAETASEPEIYGYGAWGRYSTWGVGVERTIQYHGTIRYQGGETVSTSDTLRAGADAFGLAPAASLADAYTPLQGGITWSGSLIGVDLGQAMLPPVFGDAELRVELSTLQGTASFDDLTVHVDGVSRAFRAPRLEYDISVAGNAFSNEDGRVLGGFYGPAHEEMAGVLDDRTSDVNLLAGFGGKR